MIGQKKCQETFPAEVVYAIALEVENPVKVYREYRQFTIEELADKINLSPKSLQGIEQDINLATNENLKEIANILQIDVEMITNEG